MYDGQTLYQWLEEEYTLEWQEILDIIKRPRVFQFVLLLTMLLLACKKITLSAQAEFSPHLEYSTVTNHRALLI